ncbi:MAG: chromate transporter [Bacteroidales bacterium]|jgi:chromate transporter|nr:chromate transporter [Bacteroidales bacterium]
MLLKLFFTFIKIGTFTFGGGYAMLTLVKRAVVEKNKWIEEKEFLDMIALVQSLPGVFAVNTALYVGRKTSGIKGSIAAMFGAIIPSVIIILLLAIFGSAYRDNEIVEKVFKGIRPCVVALILAPAVTMIRSAGISWKNIWLPIVAIALVGFLNVSPVYVIVGAAVAGVAVSLLKRDVK